MVVVQFAIIVSRRNFFEDEHEEVVANTLDHYPSDKEIEEELYHYHKTSFVEYARVEKRHVLELREE